MAFQFVDQSLDSGAYEPEGIYLDSPYEGEARILQYWGAADAFFSKFRYNGIALKGHPGVDFELMLGTRLLAVDQGRVVEIGYEAKGFERYLKIEHRWGESFYAYIGETTVESGQTIKRSEPIALSGDHDVNENSFLHFAIRINPYNRFDGWGGFTDPLPYLDPAIFILDDDLFVSETPSTIHSMATETSGLRRP